MSKEPEAPRRRFAPVPIETTFESVRRTANQALPGGHMPELTPEPSPRELSPVLSPALVPRAPAPAPALAPEPVLASVPALAPPREKRRFAPQLIETSRRVRRVGDTGPATKPADKTDITPYTNHIYAQKNKPRKKAADVTAGTGHNVMRQPKGARRESEDENAGNYVLEWAAKEAERQMQEAALAAFPNSRAREGGAAHFYFRESSGDDSTSVSTSPVLPGEAPKHGQRQGRLPRRKSSDLGYWHKHMQEHAEKLAHERGDGELPLDDAELDKMELEGPPDPMWTTNSRKHSLTAPSATKGPIGESLMPLITQDAPPAAKEARLANDPAASFPAIKPLGGSSVPLGPPTGPPPVKASVKVVAPAPTAAASRIPPETGFRNVGGGFGRPFGFAAQREDTRFKKMKSAASPPMLGKDLRFRRCPSPKFTKLEPEHPFRELHMPEETNRDASGQNGLWRGFCYKGSNADNLVPAELQGPRMLATPLPPSTPGDPFAQAFSQNSVTDTPESLPMSPTTAEHRPKSGEAKGLHMLHGLDDRLRREKAISDREEKILAEFNDAFITQVYNYLSLGYPATARSYDEELAKISHMEVDELEWGDESQMAAGHIFEAAEESLPEEKRCPRWKALKAYILEWARQHPDLDNLDPLAWGVRERRGSWAI